MIILVAPSGASLAHEIPGVTIATLGNPWDFMSQRKTNKYHKYN
jgi:hypothetical protein